MYQEMIQPSFEDEVKLPPKIEPLKAGVALNALKPKVSSGTSNPGKYGFFKGLKKSVVSFFKGFFRGKL